SDSFLPAPRGFQRRATTNLDAERAIATERPGAREYEVADAGESRERRSRRPEGDTEPSHLVKPTRDERSARIVAEANAFDDAGGDGHDVLECAAKLDANEVVVRVD